MGRAAGWLAASIHQALGGTQAEASCSGGGAGGGGLQVKHAATSLQSWSCCSGSEPRRRDDFTGSLGAEQTGDRGGEGGGSRWGRVRELVAVRVGPDLQLEDRCWSMGRPLAQGGERNAIRKWSQETALIGRTCSPSRKSCTSIYRSINLSFKKKR